MRLSTRNRDVVRALVLPRGALQCEALAHETENHVAEELHARELLQVFGMRVAFGYRIELDLLHERRRSWLRLADDGLHKTIEQS